jgi:hypothetical protein
MTRRTLTLAAAIALAAGSTNASAQTCSVQPPTSPTTLTCSVNHNLTATVAKTAKLALSSASTQISSATGPTVADFEASEGAGVGTSVTGPVLTAKANTPYTVGFTYTSTFTSSTKSAADIAYSTNTVIGTCGATYTSLPSTPVAQSMIAGGVPTASARRQLCFRVKWTWTTDAPGSYTLPLTFNITAL